MPNGIPLPVIQDVIGTAVRESDRNPRSDGAFAVGEKVKANRVGTSLRGVEVLCEFTSDASGTADLSGDDPREDAGEEFPTCACATASETHLPAPPQTPSAINTSDPAITTRSPIAAFAYGLNSDSAISDRADFTLFPHIRVLLDAAGGFGYSNQEGSNRRRFPMASNTRKEEIPRVPPPVAHPCRFYHEVGQRGKVGMAAPKKDRSIREDTSRIDTVVPKTLLRRLDLVAAFLGVTKRSALLVVLDEGCSLYERKKLDAEAANRE